MNTRPLSALRLRLLAATLCAASVTLLSGCMLFALGAAGAAGAGTVAYVRGELSATLANKYDDVIAASNRAVGDLRLAKISERSDAFSAVIIARTAQDKKVTITITKSADNLCELKIRIGLFGDEPMARSILDKIKAGL